MDKSYKKIVEYQGFKFEYHEGYYHLKYDQQINSQPISLKIRGGGFVYVEIDYEIGSNFHCSMDEHNRIVTRLNFNGEVVLGREARKFVNDNQKLISDLVASYRENINQRGNIVGKWDQTLVDELDYKINDFELSMYYDDISKTYRKQQ